MLPPAPRVRVPIAAIAVLAAVLSGTGCSARQDAVRSSTPEAWESDAYVPGQGRDADRVRAARVLAAAAVPLEKPVVMQVGAASAVLYERPDVLSTPVGRLAAGAAVRVAAYDRFVRVPEGALMRESSPGGTVPAWARVEAGAAKGWMPARALVSPSIAALGSDSIVAQRLAALGAAPPARNAGLPVRRGADDAAADALLAIAAKPCRFDASGAATFAWTGRLDGLPPVGSTLERLDPAMVTEVAAERTDAAVAPVADPHEPEASLWGIVQRISNADDAAQVDRAAEDVVGDLMAPAPFTPVEERMLGRACLAVRLGGTRTLAIDDPVSAYVNWVGNNLVAVGSLPHPALGTLFVVIDDPASARCTSVPGGIVLVTTGMLRALRNEHELAAVLGREVARLEERLALAAVVRGEGRALNQALQVRALLASGRMDALLSKAMQPVEERLRGEAVQKAHDRLESASVLVIAAAVDDAIAAVDRPSVADEGAVDLRAGSLMRACGWDPRALDAVLARQEAAGAAAAEASIGERRAHLARGLSALPAPEAPAAVGARWKRLAQLLGR